MLSDCLRPHGLQHSRPPCPSPTPRVYSNSCPLSQWCHPTVSSVIPFSSHLQSFPASECFPMSLFFASGGQSIGVSPKPMSTESVMPSNHLILCHPLLLLPLIFPSFRVFSNESALPIRRPKDVNYLQNCDLFYGWRIFLLPWVKNAKAKCSRCVSFEKIGFEEF